MLNPVCTCGETLTRDDPAEMIYDWVPGSPEIMRLFMLSSRGHKWVWHCFGCGFFCPGLEGNRSAPRRA